MSRLFTFRDVACNVSADFIYLGSGFRDCVTIPNFVIPHLIRNPVFLLYLVPDSRALQGIRRDDVWIYPEGHKPACVT